MTDAGETIVRYLGHVSKHDLAPLDDLLSDSLVAATGNGTYDKSEWITALARLTPALVRNHIRDVFVKGDKACAIYDFVTDTDAGAVTCVEWITIDAHGRIATVDLLFEKAEWGYVTAALAERAATNGS